MNYANLYCVFLYLYEVYLYLDMCIGILYCAHLFYVYLYLNLYFVLIIWIVEVPSVWISEEFKKFARLQLLFNSFKQMHQCGKLVFNVYYYLCICICEFVFVYLYLCICVCVLRTILVLEVE